MCFGRGYSPYSKASSSGVKFTDNCKDSPCKGISGSPSANPLS
jgi:hypothetical protein